MSTATATTPISASVFLFGDGEEGISALAGSLDEQGVLGSLGSALTKLSGAGMQAVGEQIATVAHGLLDLDLGDLLTHGWQRFDDLTDAARRTVENRGSREVVDLVSPHDQLAQHPARRGVRRRGARRDPGLRPRPRPHRQGGRRHGLRRPDGRAAHRRLRRRGQHLGPGA